MRCCSGRTRSFRSLGAHEPKANAALPLAKWDTHLAMKIVVVLLVHSRLSSSLQKLESQTRDRSREFFSGNRWFTNGQSMIVREILPARQARSIVLWPRAVPVMERTDGVSLVHSPVWQHMNMIHEPHDIHTCRNTDQWSSKAIGHRATGCVTRDSTVQNAEWDYCNGNNPVDLYTHIDLHCLRWFIWTIPGFPAFMKRLTVVGCDFFESFWMVFASETNQWQRWHTSPWSFHQSPMLSRWKHYEATTKTIIVQWHLSEQKLIIVGQSDRTHWEMSLGLFTEQLQPYDASPVLWNTYLVKKDKLFVFLWVLLTIQSLTRHPSQ
jgi:hypothetical protein